MKFNNLSFEISKKKISHFCRKNHIDSMAFFGSILTDNFTQNSDVDILINFHPKHTPHLLSLISMEQELSLLFRRKVDLKTLHDLSPYFRDQVAKKAKVFYGK